MENFMNGWQPEVRPATYKRVGAGKNVRWSSATPRTDARAVVHEESVLRVHRRGPRLSVARDRARRGRSPSRAGGPRAWVFRAPGRFERDRPAGTDPGRSPGLAARARLVRDGDPARVRRNGPDPHRLRARHAGDDR